jgi:hypothetical protein
VDKYLGLYRDLFKETPYSPPTKRMVGAGYPQSQRVRPGYADVG